MIGGRIKMLRQLMGMSLKTFGGRLGLSPQLLHRYEAGDIQVSASRLIDICRITKSKPEYFYQDFDDGQSGGRTARAQLRAERDGRASVWDLQKEGISLLDRFVRISDPAGRKAVLGMVRACANSKSSPSSTKQKG